MLSATIEEITGPFSYLVRLDDNPLVRCHQDHFEKENGWPFNRISYRKREEIEADKDNEMSLPLSPSD